MYAETDDVRGGMGLEGVNEFQKFLDAGGLLMTFGVSSYFPADFGLARGLDAQRPATGWYAPGPYVQSEILQPTHPLFYGYEGQKTLPVRWADGPLLQAGPPAEMAAFVGSSARAASGARAIPGRRGRRLERLDARRRPAPQPADDRGRALRQGPRARVVNNPIYRWQTFGEHALVFNALFFWNDLPGPASSTAGTSTARP